MERRVSGGAFGAVVATVLLAAAASCSEDARSTGSSGDAVDGSVDQGPANDGAGETEPDASTEIEAGSDAGKTVSLLVDENGNSLPVLDAPVESRTGDVDVLGVVLDDTTKAAIAGATIRIGGVQATSDASGRFAMKAPRGHALLDVREEGHVPFVRPIGLGEREPALLLRLARRVARVSVGPSGYTFALPGGALEIPPGAYPTPASMSATLVADVGVMPGDILFRMPGDRAARVLSVVEVDTSVQPAVGVTLRLPIPAGVDPAKLALYTLDEATGTWKEPVRPISVAGGVAAYTVTHFSERAQVVEGDDAVAIVRGCTAGSDIGGTPCQTGARIAAGEAVRTNGQVVELQMRNGTQATLGGKDVDHVVRDDDPVGEVTISPTCTSPTCTMSVRGSAPQASAPTPSGRMKMTVRTPPRPVVLGVRGTVFTWTSEACPGSAPSSTRASGDLAVSAGTVELQSGGAARAVDSGQSLRVCLGCATPSEAACCYDFASRACTSFGCSVHADTWVCADHERYVCTAGGLCDEPPANVSRVPPVRCSGGSDCPPTTPLCLRSASSLPDQGTCMPKDPIPQFGWDQVTIPTDPLFRHGGASGDAGGGSSGDGGSGSGSGSGDAGGGGGGN